MRQRNNGRAVWCVGAVVVLLATVAAGEAATGGWKAKLLKVTDKYYFGEKPKAPAGPKLPCHDSPPKPQLEDVVDMEDWITFLSRTQPFPDEELTYDSLAARILPEYGSLTAFLASLMVEVENEGTSKQLSTRAHALITLYEKLPDAPEHKEDDAILLVTLFRIYDRRVRMDSSFLAVGFYNFYNRIYAAMETKRFPAGMSEEDLRVIKAALEGIDERAYWRQIVDFRAEEYERSMDLAKQGRYEEIPVDFRSPQPRSWYAAPVRFYEGWRTVRIFNQMKDAYGNSYADFVERKGFPHWEDTKRWLPATVLSCFLLYRDLLARSESLNNVLLAAMDAELALRAGKSVEEATALVAVYQDGGLGDPVRLKQDGDKNVIMWRFTDGYGRYHDTETYSWPAR
ncbi:MAG: hypothetical protein GXY15_05380 [Candidatus Hydrogenedentes bacterium]|mgnify:CR=1 FL=1|nr:hypothetical protein [Candidatus Hydrogenedentota bacterium]